MSFEEKFPSLKNKIRLPGKEWATVLCSTIEENCLDKQKVKEAIDKLKTRESQYMIYKQALLEELEYLLGIDEE